jgi:hypothetical protein
MPVLCAWFAPCRALKEAKRKEKEKAKNSGLKSFFSSKKKEEVDLEEDHEDYEEVRGACGHVFVNSND